MNDNKRCPLLGLWPQKPSARLISYGDIQSKNKEISKVVSVSLIINEQLIHYLDIPMVTRKGDELREKNNILKFEEYVKAYNKNPRYFACNDFEAYKVDRTIEGEDWLFQLIQNQETGQLLWVTMSPSERENFLSRFELDSNLKEICQCTYNPEPIVHDPALPKGFIRINTPDSISTILHDLSWYILDYIAQTILCYTLKLTDLLWSIVDYIGPLFLNKFVEKLWIIAELISAVSEPGFQWEYFFLAYYYAIMDAIFAPLFYDLHDNLIVIVVVGFIYALWIDQIKPLWKATRDEKKNKKKK